ncbi:NAD(P)H-binding protein [Nonomuraea sp. NPDC049695]|uniref:NAD(P)-dependent oxidoreductase n=1 Tax=Nonomuraea sp. NPDC049695 TaxID=3154734 RepID=UPI003434CD55
MKLTVFGATGGIGRCLVEQATAAGHEVTAVVRDPAKISLPVRTVTADLLTADQATLQRAVAEADAVLSTVGPPSNALAGVASRGTEAIVRAMRATEARRLIAVSAAPVGAMPSPGRPHPPKHDPGDRYISRADVAHYMLHILDRPETIDRAVGIAD